MIIFFFFFCYGYWLSRSCGRDVKSRVRVVLHGLSGNELLKRRCLERVALLFDKSIAEQREVSV
jgi:hypothetical protein